jgi:hypothetical protein
MKHTGNNHTLYITYLDFKCFLKMVNLDEVIRGRER